MESSVYGADGQETSNSKAATGTGHRRKGGNSVLIKKLFYRQIGSQKQNGDDLPVRSNDDNLSEHPFDILCRDLQITPCPCVRPAGFKLEPRVEFYPPRQRGPVNRQPPVVDFRDSISSSGELTNLRVLRLSEDLVAAAAADPTHLKAWTKYLKCYAEGRFSLMMPPDPPPMKSSFTYLPAIFPANEAERLATLEMCNTEWSDWAVERARTLVCDAMKKFKAPWAAISIFDRDLEIVKAECGYHRQFVRRQESIAAHVLLSNDIMFIPDTKMDWRFAGNPLVVGDPNIRFFAGAPLLTANGEVIGVFSVFGPEPRERFTIVERRELTDFAGMAMSDLTFLMDRRIDESQRGTPILQRTELINHISPPEQLYGSRQKKARETESGSDLPGLRYHKASAIRRSKPRLIIDGQRKEPLGTTSEHTPPNSDDSDEESTSSRIKGYTKNFKELTVDSRPTQDSKHDLLTPDSSSFPLLLPRAFSGSDLTSVEHNQHCVTPEIWCDESADLRVLKADEIVEHTLTQSPSAFDKEYPDSPTIRGVHVVGDAGSPNLSLHGRDFAYGAKPPQPSENHLSIISTDLDLNNRRSLDDTPTSGIESESVFSKSTTVTYPDDQDYPVDQSDSNHAPVIPTNLKDVLICQDIETNNTQVEADFAADFAARNLGFDCVYAASFTPARPFMTDTQLAADGGMIVRILASYGLPDDVGLNVPLHLSIIRGHGMKFWEDDKSLPGECGKGFMMRLKSSGGTQSRRSQGVVFGAFRNTPSNGEPLPKVTISEFQRLRDAALALKSILFKKPVRNHVRCRTEPPTPAESYSVLDAIETGKFSLDAGIERIGASSEEPDFD